MAGLAVQRAGVAESRSRRGHSAHAGGLAAEAAGCDALIADGWEVLARRARTAAGEVDIVARRGGLVAFVEVKARATLAEAAHALAAGQSRRLLRAAEALLALHPDWGAGDLRFDVLLVDAGGRVRRIADALRAEQ
jgi:putative endonuclease